MSRWNVATSRGPSTRRPGRLKIILGALVLVAVAVGADWWQANREMDALLEKVEGTERQISSAVENLEFTIRFSVLAGLDENASQEVRDAARAQATQRLAVASARAAQAMERARTDMESVRIVPWHRSLRDAKSASADHSAAWLDLFVAAAAEPARLVDPSLGDRVQETSRTRRVRLDDARPLWALHDAEDRIDRIDNQTERPFS